ncbi:MAG: hypothetical protein AB7K09_13325 [Planctomycetota bacterium]
MTEPIVVTGMITPDGHLELSDALNLPAGPVEVTVVPLSGASSNPFWASMREIWATLRAAGHVPRTAEEIADERRQMLDDSEVRQLRLERIQAESAEARRMRGNP